MNIIILYFEAHCAIAPIPLPGNYRKLLQRRSGHSLRRPSLISESGTQNSPFSSTSGNSKTRPLCDARFREIADGIINGHQRYYHFKGNALSTSGNKYYTTANVLYLMIRFINEWDNYETFISKSTIINFWQINVNFRFGEKFVFYRLKFRSKML